MQNCYDPYLDEKIFEIIDKNNNNETQFNDLVRLLDKTPRTISKHLEFLTYNQKILHWQKNPPSKKGSIKFRNKAVIKKRKYGLLTVDYSDRRGICKEWKRKNEIENTKEMKKKTMLFLLIAFAYGYTGYKPTSEPSPGDIAIPDDKGRFIDVSLYSEKGFSIEDLDREDFQFSAIHNILRLKNRFTKLEIGEMFEELKKYKDIILKPAFGSDGKVRYNIEDDVLEELLIWCFNILRSFVRMMIQYWFILDKKPKREEAQWFNFVVGEKAVIDLFTKIDKNRVEKKTTRELYIEYHFKGTDLDKEMIDRSLKNMEAYYQDKYHLHIFTQKGMEKYIFTQSNESITLHNHCTLIASDKEKYQELIKEEKYQWIFEELADLINPPFSRNKYKVKLT